MNRPSIQTVLKYPFIVSSCFIGLTGCEQSATTTAIPTENTAESSQKDAISGSADKLHVNTQKEREEDQENVSDNATSLETPAAVKPIGVDNHAIRAAEQVAESIKLSQARFAASSRDKCPKLLSRQVDSTEIVRPEEVLTSDYCDYYLYPMKGDEITVESNPTSVRANLIAPVPHDFADGKYVVNKTDKYVIRLAYKGGDYRPQSLDYNVKVNVQ